MHTHFRAPWGTKLKLITGGLLGLAVVLSFQSGAVSGLLAVLFIVALILSVRGYSISDGRLLIHRMGWATKYDLARLRSTEFSPGATMGSARLFGIGGLFGIVGHFRNEILGRYRAYATNEETTVVLKFDKETVVVSPERPAEFVEAVRAQHPSPAGEPAA